MKLENNVNDDARVLYDFANSKKSQNETPPTFPSSTSLFASKQTSIEMTSAGEVQQQQLTKEMSHEHDTSSSSSSTYSSQSAMDATMPSEELNESSATNTSAAVTGQIQQQPNQAYTDFHFNYMYNNGGTNVMAVTSAEQADIKQPQQFPTFYQNSNNNNNNNTTLLEDSSSSKHYTEYQQQQHHNHHPVQHQSHHQWFNNNNNYQTSEPNVTPISSNHSVSNMNNPLDGSEVSKYLDLDSCKREQNIDIIVGDRSCNCTTAASTIFLDFVFV